MVGFFLTTLRALQELEAAGAQVQQNGATLQLNSVRLQGYGPFRSAHPYQTTNLRLLFLKLLYTKIAKCSLWGILNPSQTIPEDFDRLKMSRNLLYRKSNVPSIERRICSEDLKTC